jgi:hypothetical protein
MKHVSALVAVASLCVALVVPARAQEDVLRPHLPPRLTYGVEAGANYNMFSLDMERRMGIQGSPFDAYLEGDGVSPFIALSADYRLTKRFGVQFELGYDQKRIGNSRQGIADVAITRPAGAVIYDTTNLTLDYTVVTTYITTGFLGRFNITPQLFVSAGPVFHFRLDSTEQTEIETIPEDDIAVFEDGSKRRETVTRIQSKPSMRMGIELTTGFRIPVAREIAIVPQLHYQYMITDFIEDRNSEDKYRRHTESLDQVRLTNTQLHSIQLGIGVQFAM